MMAPIRIRSVITHHARHEGEFLALLCHFYMENLSASCERVCLQNTNPTARATGAVDKYPTALSSPSHDKIQPDDWHQHTKISQSPAMRSTMGSAICADAVAAFVVDCMGDEGVANALDLVAEIFLRELLDSL